MSKKIRVICSILLTAALFLTALFIICGIIMPPCKACGKRLCSGVCEYKLSFETPQTPQTPEVSQTPNNSTDKKPTINQKHTLLEETAPQDESYLDKIAFVGDSRTVALNSYGIPRSSIYALNGMTHESAMYEKCVTVNGEKTTIAKAIRANQPEIMIVNFGINGISWMDKASFMQGYDKLIQTLADASPSSIIVIEAIMPVSAAYASEHPRITNAKIDRYNELLYEYAKENGYYYLDTDSVLKDENNNLNHRYSSDGLHYNQRAYGEIIDYILTHAIIKN